VTEGDTDRPDDKYLVSLNKWSVDRFQGVGPLLPQNFQLIDIDNTGERMRLLYDMPIGLGEPHYAQIIKADKLDPWDVYPEVGWDSLAQAVKPDAPRSGEERIERDGNRVEIWMTAIRSHFNPAIVEINKGDHVTWHITNIERAKDAVHGFALPAYNVNLSLEPGETQTIDFVADQDGVFSFYCTEFCSALHLEMTGYFLVRPEGAEPVSDDPDEGGGAEVEVASDDPLVAEGRTLAQEQGCLACHTTDGSPLLGPTWLGLYGKQETLSDGSTVEVDEEYLRESIVDPNAKLVEGFPPSMSPYAHLSEAQLDALIAYLKSLADEPEDREQGE